MDEHVRARERLLDRDDDLSDSVVRIAQRHVAAHLQMEVDELAAARAPRPQLVVADEDVAMLAR